MKTQVLIPAQNEAERLPRLLEWLPPDTFDVHIAVNGSEDGTADVARRYSSFVYETETAGKLPALQHTFKRLGALALSPLLLLDADTRPLAPKRWEARMMSALRPDESVPTVVSAPVLFRADRAAVIDPITRSIVRYLDTTRSIRSAKRHPLKGAQFGPNMGLHIATDALLDELLELPHVWPKEDVAVVKTVVDSHPDAEFRQLISPATAAMTDRSASMQSLLQWILHPAATAAAEERAYQQARPSDDQVSFDAWLQSKG